MRRRHCQGCSASEDEGLADQAIIPVTITISGEHPTRSWEAEDTWTEDLCLTCRETLLVRFMGKKPREGILDPPVLWRGVG